MLLNIIFLGYEDESEDDGTFDFDVGAAASLITVSDNTGRASMGMKRPRAGLVSQLPPKRPRVSECQQCEDLLAQLEELKHANELLTSELNKFKVADGNPPRPGKVPENLAKKYNVSKCKLLFVERNDILVNLCFTTIFPFDICRI